MKIVLLAVLMIATGAQAIEEKDANKNPLLADWWQGLHGGLPPFDKVKVEDFKPALEEAMKLKRAEIQAIANNPAAPTFDNTILALEQAGNVMNRVLAIYQVWESNMNTPDFQAVDKEMAPKLAAFDDEIVQNSKLFQRIEAVYKDPATKKLNHEQRRLVWLDDMHFVLAGARLDDTQKKRVSEINQRLASLYTQFSQNELGDEEDDALILDKKADLDGLPSSLVDAAAAEADRRKMPGKWVIANTRSAMEPFLTYSARRDLREKGFRIWTSRGDNDNAHNNNKIVTEILNLRQERAKILGYPTYAHWRLADTMAKTPETAMDLMMKVWRPAVAAVKNEVADMQAIVDKENGGFKIQPWDYRYYAEKVRKAKYDLDLESIKPYLQLEHIREAMFWSAGQLYGFKFKKLKGIAVFQPSMSVYQVNNRQGKMIGIWYFDPYARAGKNSGAWMTDYRVQQRIGGKSLTAIVSNNANFIPGKPGEPVLISWDDAVTMFHEFGHALHALNSNVTYPSLAGTNTTRDFVEFPSQFNENYLETAGVLKFLTDVKGHPLPKDLIKKIDRTKTFNQGFETTEFLASGIVDMMLHLSTEKNIDPRAFEKKALAEIGMPAEIVMRHRIPHFGHIFSGEDYAAGYYGYLWSQVLDYDAYEAFTETGNPYDKATAKRFHDDIMSVGNTVDPAETYRKFRGRDAKVDALLRARGFPIL